MNTNLNDFQRKKKCLICVDSDGCAMNTMDIKHTQCFGPCMIEEWGLSRWKTPILQRWDEINLYTMTRGINRFQGLAMALQEIDRQYCKIQSVEDLVRWVSESDELSNSALKEMIQNSGSICLSKALRWSEKVNEKINALPDEQKKPFDGVREALAAARDQADIAIVSSANLEAVKEEWERNGLLEYVDVLLAQNVGSKEHCIQELLKKGYDVSCVMMTGDAVGDYEAAEKNGVLYFPILVRKEKESWREFRECAVKKLSEGTFAGTYQQNKIKEFLKNLR